MKIPTSVFHILKMCDPNPEGKRYALDGVRVEIGPDGQPYAVATDGCYLIAATWTGDDSNSEIITTVVPLRVCENVASMLCAAIDLTKDPADPRMQIVAEGNDASHQITTGEVEGRYPLWRDILTADREDEDAAVAYVDARRLRDMLEAMILAYGENCNVTLKIRGCNTDEPLTLSAQRTDGLKLMTVLLQLRGNGDPTVPRDCDWTPGSKPTDA